MSMSMWKAGTLRLHL